MIRGVGYSERECNDIITDHTTVFEDRQGKWRYEEGIDIEGGLREQKRDGSIQITQWTEGKQQSSKGAVV